MKAKKLLVKSNFGLLLSKVVLLIVVGGSAFVCSPQAEAQETEVVTKMLNPQYGENGDDPKSLYANTVIRAIRAKIRELRAEKRPREPLV